jgi:hypothetical protein
VTTALVDVVAYLVLVGAATVAVSVIVSHF